MLVRKIESLGFSTLNIGMMSPTWNGYMAHGGDIQQNLERMR